MRHARTDSRFHTERVPEDLLIFEARMANCGIGVRLPTAGSDYRLPEPIEVEGESLSATVIRLRNARD